MKTCYNKPGHNGADMPATHQAFPTEINTTPWGDLYYCDACIDLLSARYWRVERLPDDDLDAEALLARWRARHIG